MGTTTAAVAISTLLLGLTAVPAQAADQAVTAQGMRWDLDGTATVLPPPPGATGAHPEALSDTNFAAGFASTPSGSTYVMHGVRWDASGVPTDLAPPAGDPEADARAINDDGVAAGRSFGGTPFLSHAVRWGLDGTPTHLAEVPGASYTEAYAIADDGTAVGQSGATDDTSKPVKWAPDGTLTVLPMPAGSARGSAKLITDTGWITGYAFPNGEMHVVRWDPAGTLTDLGAPSTQDNVPVDITDDGTVVETSDEHLWDGTYTKAWSVVWDPAGTATELARPDGYKFGSAHDMNNSHVSVGLVSGPEDEKIVRWTPDGAFTVLTTIPGSYSDVVGINDAGLIAGTANSEAVRWSAAGVPTGLGTPPGCVSAGGVAINEGGSVLGAGQ